MQCRQDQGLKAAGAEAQQERSQKQPANHVRSHRSRKINRQKHTHSCSSPHDGSNFHRRSTFIVKHPRGATSLECHSFLPTLRYKQLSEWPQPSRQFPIKPLRKEGLLQLHHHIKKISLSNAADASGCIFTLDVFSSWSRSFHRTVWVLVLKVTHP